MIKDKDGNTLKDKDGKPFKFDGKQGKEIWDKKSETFPRFDPKDTEVAKCLSILYGFGFDVAGKDVLELGCGTGRYGLSLAKKAHHIYELDISSGMLNVLSESAKEYGIDNVTTICSDFDALNFSQALGRDKIPLMIAAMTPALNNKAALLKALAHTEEAIAYIGFGATRKSELLEALYKEHNAVWKLPSGLPDVLHWLKEEGYQEPRYEYIKSPCTFEKDYEESLKSIAWHIEVADVTPNMPLIEEYARRYLVKDKDGKEVVRYSVEKEMGIALIHPR